MQTSLSAGPHADGPPYILLKSGWNVSYWFVLVVLLNPLYEKIASLPVYQ